MTLRALDFSAVRGALQFDAPLAPLSWFRVGGPAELLFSPEDENDLAVFLRVLPRDVPVMVIGLGSNLLVRDGGVRGAVIRLGKAFHSITVEAEYHVRAGAAVPDVKVARVAAEAGIKGFSFLRGIPGSIGGALRMNGGAYGGEIKDIFVSARGINRSGDRVSFDHQAMGFSYRHTKVDADVIFTEAVFKGEAGNSEAILAEMNAITDARASTQPVKTRTGGSTFRNPEGMKAWELIDRAGLRGHRIGAAEISPLHTNFLIAHPGATAADIEALGEEARRRVKAQTGIDLVWEIKIIGEPA